MKCPNFEELYPLIVYISNASRSKHSFSYFSYFVKLVEMFYDRGRVSGRNADCTVSQITGPVFLLNALCTFNRFICGRYDRKFAASVAFVRQENSLAVTYLPSHLPETSAELLQAQIMTNCT